MKNSLTVIAINLVLAVVLAMIISAPVEGDCSSGIKAVHLDKTAKAFVDDETIEINDTNGLQVKAISGFYAPSSVSGTNDSNGSCTLPNGLQMRWGKVELTGTGGTVSWSALDLPDFSNACFHKQRNCSCCRNRDSG